MMNGDIADQYWYVDVEDSDTIEFDDYEEAYDWYMNYRAEFPDRWITLGCVTDRVVGTFTDKDPPRPNEDYDDDYDDDQVDPDPYVIGYDM